MYIESIRLVDWKAYVDETIQFPKPTKKKNVVLIGAMNGYGKTSLLEAIILGLFGREGLGVLARAVIREGESDRLSYDNFLERALHARALEEGRRSASVSITVRDDQEAIKIERKWHFSSSGKHRRDDEEARIWTGPDRDAIKIPRMDERNEFLRTYIQQHFLPVHLAQFFLFDGEQVQRLAQRDMSSQVRLGIEGMLGVPVMRELSQDLAAYARDRRSSSGKTDDDSLNRLRTEAHELEAVLQASERELGMVVRELDPLRARRDKIVKDLGALHKGSYASLREHHEKKGQLARERDQERENVATLLRGDLALALAGRDLRARIVARLTAEGTRSKWELGKEQSADALPRLLRALDASEVPIDPPLTAPQAQMLRKRIRAVWESIWQPLPAQAEGYRHTYLGPSDRALVLDRLRQVNAAPLGGIKDTLSAIKALEEQIRRIDSKITRVHGVSDKAADLTAELEVLNKQLGDLEGRHRDLERKIESDRAQLDTKKERLTGVLEGEERAQPQVKRAALADKISNLIEEVIRESYPLHIAEVATHMTAAYKAMAHKTLVRSISINEDCTVRLHGDEGRDMGSMDASAGENQIFALSLIAAIGRAAGRDFPIVMDTPLARLDSAHRLNVLRYFTQRFREQVILLSQSDEVRGPYLDAIRDQVAGTFKIEHEELGNGVGHSRIVSGYFEEEA